jgi:hypothetical protein
MSLVGLLPPSYRHTTVGLQREGLLEACPNPAASRVLSCCARGRVKLG